MAETPIVVDPVITPLSFSEKYTTDPLDTTKKCISIDTYANCEQLEKVYNAVNVLGFRLARLQ